MTKRGACRVCHLAYSLTKSGLVRKHDAPSWSRRNKATCTGSGQAPKPAPVAR